MYFGVSCSVSVKCHWLYICCLSAVRVVLIPPKYIFGSAADHSRGSDVIDIMYFGSQLLFQVFVSRGLTVQLSSVRLGCHLWKH